MLSLFCVARQMCSVVKYFHLESKVNSNVTSKLKNSIFYVTAEISNRSFSGLTKMLQCELVQERKQ